MMDPNFYDDDYDDPESYNQPDFGGMEDPSDCCEEYVYDTYDRIFSEDEVEPPELDPHDDLDAIEMGMAFAFAETVIDAERKKYDVDENTDQDNWNRVNEVLSLESRHTSKQQLRPFEQYISEICNGRRPLFKNRRY